MRWTVDGGSILDEDGREVCYVRPRTEEGSGRFVLRDARARLIAAAPEMLEWLDGLGSWEVDIGIAALVARVKGGPT